MDLVPRNLRTSRRTIWDAKGAPRPGRGMRRTKVGEDEEQIGNWRSGIAPEKDTVKRHAAGLLKLTEDGGLNAVHPLVGDIEHL
jgi:hypothetical protein